MTSRVELRKDFDTDSHLRLIDNDLDVNDTRHDDTSEEMGTIKKLLIGFLVSITLLAMTITAATANSLLQARIH